MNSPILRKLASSLLGVLLLFYIGYQVYNSHYKKVQTETAVYATSDATVQVTGTAIREEKLVDGKVSGVVHYIIPSGGKVANGEKVAEFYANDKSAAAQEQVQALEASIAKLQKLGTPGDTFAASPDSLSKQINLKLADLLYGISSCRYADLSDSRENFLYLVNERQVVTDKVTDFSGRIAALKAQQKALADSNNAKPTGSVTAPVAGYFIHSTDGYETLFDFSKAQSLTVNDLKAKQNSKPVSSGGSIGKICSQYNWYFAFVLPENKASMFKPGNSVSIDFSFASNSPVPATIAAVNRQADTGECTVILQSSMMSATLASVRTQTAQVQMDEYTGIRVSQKAVHFETVSKTTKDKDGKPVTVKKEVQGVYVLHGNEIRFQQIFPLYSTDTYVICNSEPNAADLMTESTVKLSDEVVVEGSDLYNGKVIK